MTNDKFVLVPIHLLKNLLDSTSDIRLKNQIKSILKTREVIEKQEVTKLPKKAKIKHVIDGDTVELQNGLVLRYVGITAPETGEPFEKESAEENRRLVEGKTIELKYDNYKSDKFGRILAYAIVDEKNVSIELTRKGLAELVIYQKRKPFIYQEELLKVQEQAKKKKLGIWSNRK